MAAKPSRLAKNRHGTYCLRWIVPARMRADGSPREIRFSLRTTDPGEARILALEFNLALERVRAATRAKQRSAGTTAPLTVIGRSSSPTCSGNKKLVCDPPCTDKVT